MEQAKSSPLGNPVKLIAGIAVLGVVLWFVLKIKGILLPFALAFVLSYVLAPLVDRLEGRGVNRVLSILFIFILVFSGLMLGAFQAGTKLTAEMIELSEQFLVQEEVDQEVTVLNKGPDSAIIEGIKGVDPEHSAFYLIDSPGFPVELEPAKELVLKLRFKPSSTEPVEGSLNIASPALTEPFTLRMQGNSLRSGEESPDFWFWEEGRYRDSVQVQTLVFSRGGAILGVPAPASSPA
jgi:hypothetical protein